MRSSDCRTNCARHAGRRTDLAPLKPHQGRKKDGGGGRKRKEEKTNDRARSGPEKRDVRPASGGSSRSSEQRSVSTELADLSRKRARARGRRRTPSQELLITPRFPQREGHMRGTTAKKETNQTKKTENGETMRRGGCLENKGWRPRENETEKARKKGTNASSIVSADSESATSQRSFPPLARKKEKTTPLNASAESARTPPRIYTLALELVNIVLRE
ncbi:hypothetical protein MTO96_020722 [Rhipicephalus appendiculatus]